MSVGARVLGCLLVALLRSYAQFDIMVKRRRVSFSAQGGLVRSRDLSGHAAGEEVR